MNNKLRAKKLLLINPITKSSAIGFGQTKGGGIPPLALGYLAALTPKDWDVEIVDESIGDTVNWEEPIDLVGITTLTSVVNRVYELCGQFKERKIPTILGGIHPSMLPDEALDYADSIVIGEAESEWKKVISDFEKGQLKRKYYGVRLSLNSMPFPKRDIFSDKYRADVIQTTRGCPFDCEFCVGAAFSGHSYRQRPVDDVLDELKTVKKNIIYFVDDNIFGAGKKAEKRALELFQGMIKRKLGKIWVSQVSLNFADNPEILKYAYKSGCRGVYVGVESIRPDNLKKMKKIMNLKAGKLVIKNAVNNFHRNGIAVCGSFIFGNDNDDISLFQQTLDFIKKSNLDTIDPHILHPYPGTKLFDRLNMEKRIVYDNYPEDWGKSEHTEVMFKPQNITIAHLIRGFDYINQRLFSRKAIFLQFFKTLLNTRSLAAARFAYQMNTANRLMYNGKIFE